MAVYKLFPSQDATIYSRYPNKNTGLDEILSVSIEDAQDSGNTQAARTLIQFSSTEIADVITNKVSGSTWGASLRGFIAEANGLNFDTILEVYAVTGSWNMGTGKYSYSPEYTNGVSWYDKLSSGSGAWRTAGFPTGVTGSYGSVSGGGNWYTSSYTQSFSYYNDKDININVTPIVKKKPPVLKRTAFSETQTCVRLLFDKLFLMYCPVFFKAQDINSRCKRFKVNFLICVCFY